MSRLHRKCIISIHNEIDMNEELIVIKPPMWMPFYKQCMSGSRFVIFLLAYITISTTVITHIFTRYGDNIKGGNFTMYGLHMKDNFSSYGIITNDNVTVQKSIEGIPISSAASQPRVERIVDDDIQHRAGSTVYERHYEKLLAVASQHNTEKQVDAFKSQDKSDTAVLEPLVDVLQDKNEISVLQTQYQGEIGVLESQKQREIEIGDLDSPNQSEVSVLHPQHKSLKTKSKLGDLKPQEQSKVSLPLPQHKSETGVSQPSDVREVGEDTWYTPPPHEKPKQRFPKAVIIGFQKCGTRSLLEALSMHPYIKACTPEIHFYDRDTNFVRGYGWYRSKMVPTYSDQITMEKTPSYSLSQRAIDEMKSNFPRIKLITVVCNPVDRIISAYAQQVYKEDRDRHTPLHYSLQRFYANKTGIINPERRCVNISSYSNHLSKWFSTFSPRQILVVDGASLISDPLAVVKDAELFLGIPPMLSSFNFVKSNTSGYFCYRRFGQKYPACFRSTSKGRSHEVLKPTERTVLEKYFKPYNDALFTLLNRTFKWTPKYDLENAVTL